MLVTEKNANDYNEVSVNTHNVSLCVNQSFQTVRKNCKIYITKDRFTKLQQKTHTGYFQMRQHLYKSPTSVTLQILVWGGLSILTCHTICIGLGWFVKLEMSHCIQVWGGLSNQKCHIAYIGLGWFVKLEMSHCIYRSGVVCQIRNVTLIIQVWGGLSNYTCHTANNGLGWFVKLEMSHCIYRSGLVCQIRNVTLHIQVWDGLSNQVDMSL